MSPRLYALTAAATFAALAGGTAACTVWVDPYLLRADVVAGDAAPPVRPLRRAELTQPLRAIARQPDVLLVGSSRTLLGLDPADVDAGAGVVSNVGVCGVRFDEAADLLEFVLTWTRPHTVAVEVHPTAFNAGAPRRIPSTDPASVDRLVEALATAFLGWDGLHDAARTVRESPGPARTKVSPAGFAAMAAFDADKVGRNLAESRDAPPLELAAWAAPTVERVVRLCGGRGIRLVFYFPPVHRDYEGTLAGGPEAGAAVRDLVRRRAVVGGGDVEVYDFRTLPGLTDRPLVASTAEYLDHSHFTPAVGRGVLRRIGLPVRHADDPARWPTPDRFGVRVDGDRFRRLTARPGETRR